MALSSDEIVKREIVDVLGIERNGLKLRIFPEGSNQDQKKFDEGGLTFSFGGLDYGSCDACWIEKSTKMCAIALEGTDALNRKSSGNAQLQRFHHALGAVKSGVLGIYYLRKGSDKIRPDLFGMAHKASLIEQGDYLILDDLETLREIIDNYGTPRFKMLVSNEQRRMKDIFDQNFLLRYKNNWDIFAKNRSTIIFDNYVIKHAGRMKRNFTDGSQRAGHIAVGEMFFTKYLFYNKDFYYLFPKMTEDDLVYLDKHKAHDKEWALLRNENRVFLRTVDDIVGLPSTVRDNLISIKDDPLKGEAFRIYRKCIKVIEDGLRNGSLSINLK
jgi:hypothetical protein